MRERLGDPRAVPGFSLHIPSWHAILYDPGDSDHRQFQSNDVGMAFAESRPARHSQSSRNPFRAGDDFRGFLVHTSATVCQFARPLHGSDRLPSQRGFYIRAFSGLVALSAAGYNYNSDWTPLLAGLSPAGMAASFAARSFTTGWNHQQVQPCPLFADHYRNGEPLNPTRRANYGSHREPQSLS